MKLVWHSWHFFGISESPDWRKGTSRMSRGWYTQYIKRKSGKSALRFRDSGWKGNLFVCRRVVNCKCHRVTCLSPGHFYRELHAGNALLERLQYSTGWPDRILPPKWAENMSCFYVLRCDLNYTVTCVKHVGFKLSWVTLNQLLPRVGLLYIPKLNFFLHKIWLQSWSNLYILWKMYPKIDGSCDGRVETVKSISSGQPTTKPAQNIHILQRRRRRDR